MDPDRCNPTRLLSEEHRVQVVVLHVITRIALLGSGHQKYDRHTVKDAADLKRFLDCTASRE